MAPCRKTKRNEAVRRPIAGMAAHSWTSSAEVSIGLAEGATPSKKNRTNEQHDFFVV